MGDKMPNVDCEVERASGMQCRQRPRQTPPIPLADGWLGRKGNERKATPQDVPKPADWLAALPRIHAPSTDQRAASRGTVGLGAAVKAALWLRHITCSISASGSAPKVGLKGQVSVPGGCGWPLFHFRISRSSGWDGSDPPHRSRFCAPQVLQNWGACSL